MMKIAILVLLLLCIMSCSEGKIEELAFRKTLEYNLVDLCGKQDKECAAAVKSQIKECMIRNNWRKFMDNQESEKELNRFSRGLYACIVDSNGDPYFSIDS